MVILVPRRADGGHRDRLWSWCRRRWEALHPEWPIYEGHHDEGPFSRAQAINTAAELAGDWKVAVVIDADILLEPAQVKKAVTTAKRTGKVTWAHRGWRGLTRRTTEHMLREDPSVDVPEERPHYAEGKGDDIVERPTPLSWSCCIAIPRKAWDAIGGFDERFRGWGWEDMAFMSMACGLVGHRRIDGVVWHLWHDRPPGLGRAGRVGRALSPEAIRSARLGRRYMVALRRDHGLVDRPDPATLEELERDIGNLKRDNERLELEAERAGMARWDDWWPTLEELRDGAEPKVHADVAIIVHSGGTPEAWEARRGYLVRALESINERVSVSSVERRVVYSDWGADIAPELQAIADEHGFYVVGTSHHVGYTRNTQFLWRYIDQRVRAPFVFLTEDDFVLERDVDLDDMANVLVDHPKLAQIALLRGPYPSEEERGGILGHPEDAFTRHRNGSDTGWLSHRRFFTMNPSLIRRTLARHPWPSAESSERVFANHLFRDPQVESAFWGDGEAWIRHIGEVRAGEGY